MKNPAFITEDNLIGSIASAILKLETIDAKPSNKSDLKEFVSLIGFIGRANKENYRDLLYDKNFFVSEAVLNNLHNEMIRVQFREKVDFSSLIARLNKNLDNYVAEEVDGTIEMLQEIMMFLFQSKSPNQTYL